MKSKRTNKVMARILSIKPFVFISLTLISLIICITALRSNNVHMIKLRSEVYAADQNNGDVAGALTNLQKYVTTHMNTNLSSDSNAVYPPIQLENTYKRLITAQSNDIANNNTQLYTEAENYCQIQVPNGFSGRYRIPCIEQYISSHSLKTVSIDQSLYEFDFISPTWSPDLAGFSLLLTIVLSLITVISILGRRYYKIK